MGKEWNDKRIVAAAEAGDFTQLIWRLESIIGFAEDPTFKTLLSPNTCRVLIKILKGEIRAPKKRPPDKVVAARRFFIAFEVEYLKRHGMPIKAAVGAAAGRFCISTRLVYEERKKYPIDDCLYEKIMSNSPLGADWVRLIGGTDDARVGGWLQHFADLIDRHRTSVCT